MEVAERVGSAEGAEGEWPEVAERVGPAEGIKPDRPEDGPTRFVADPVAPTRSVADPVFCSVT
jgi:hypothetical protein